MVKSIDPKALLGLYDIESEDLVLAAALKNHQHTDALINRLKMEMFGDIVRQYIFGAAIELQRHGFAITIEGVIAKSRELATKNRLKNKGFVTAPAVQRLLDISTEDVDILARAATVANNHHLRTYADSAADLVDMIAQHPDHAVLRRQFLGLLSSVSLHQQAETDGIYYGFDAYNRMNGMLDELDEGLLIRFSWPWEAFKFVPPLPVTFCSLWGMIDGGGKSATAESLGRHNAKKGYTVAYVATEYEQKILDARILAQISGIEMSTILAGSYEPSLRRILDAANEFYSQNYPTLHYVSGSGLSMAEICGKIYMLKEKPDIVILDYLQDIAFGADDHGDENLRGNNAMRMFHNMLKVVGAAGFVVSQFTKMGHNIASPLDLKRSLLNLGQPAISKSQCTVLAYRNDIMLDGGDIAWNKHGIPLEKGVGRRGQQSRVIQVHVTKQTLGQAGYCYLNFTKNQVVKDLPPRVVDHLGGVVTYRPKEEGEEEPELSPDMVEM